MTTATRILDGHVSLFAQANDTTVKEHLPLRDVLGRIQDGTYAPQVQRLRTIKATGDKEAYRVAKEKTVGFTPACDLTTRDKATPWPEKLRSPTGLLHYDYDHVPDPAALQARLAHDPHCCFALLSPGGDGVKAAFAASGITDYASYQHAWHTMSAYLREAFPDVQVTEDRHVKYLGALCFVSHDPLLFCREDGFQIVMAKFWGLRLSKGHRRLEAFRLLSDTVAPNELMRQCFTRRQSERLLPGVWRIFRALPKCLIKRRFLRHLRTHCGTKRNSLTPKISRMISESQYRMNGVWRR